MTQSAPSTSAAPGIFGYTFSLVGILAFAVILFWAVVALFAPQIAPYPIGKIVDMDYFGPMSSKLWLGSDYLGRDMLSRIIFGARYTLGIALAGVLIASSSGVILGMAAAVVGGWFDTALSRFMDAMISIPSKLFGLVVVAAVGSSLPR